MKPLYLIAASALAMTAAACGPKTPPVRAALDCPLKQGDLTRTSASPDGKVCTYTNSGAAGNCCRFDFQLLVCTICCSSSPFASSSWSHRSLRA